jgi:hypothetical protein
LFIIFFSFDGVQNPYFFINVELYFLNLEIAYDKLGMYELWVHPNIDGAFHYVVYAQVTCDKKQETIFEPFMAAMAKFGVPTL